MAVQMNQFNINANLPNVNIGTNKSYKFITIDKALKHYNSMADTSYELTSNEITNLETQILHQVQWKLATPQLLTTNNIGTGLTKHKFDKWTAPRAPRRSERFRGTKMEGVKKEEVEIDLIGIDYDFFVDMIDQDAHNNPNSTVTFAESLRQGTFVELWNALFDYRERIIFRGADIPTDYGWVNTGETGLLNDANLTTPTFTTTDMTSAGSLVTAALELSQQLTNAKFISTPGNRYQLHMSPGIYTQSMKNRNATTGITDKEYIENLGIFDEIVMNPFMINSFTETNTTGAMGAFARMTPPIKGAPPVNNENFRIVESYSPGTYALPPQGLEFPMKILWMGRAEVRRPDAIAFKEGLTQNTQSA